MKGFAWARFILICGLLLRPGSLAVAPVMAQSPQGPGPQVTEAADGLVLEWSTPRLSVQKAADGQTRLEIAGYTTVAIPGQPELPQTSVLLAIPPGAVPALTILEAQSVPFNLPGPIVTASRPSGVRRSAAGAVIGGDFEVADPSPLIPLPVADLEEVGIQRGVHLMRVAFNPLQWTGSTWQYTQSLRARISYNTRNSQTVQTTGAGRPDPILDQIRQQVINPDQVIPVNRPASIAAVSAVTSVSPQAAVVVSGSGLTQITYAALKTAGFPVDSLNPQMLQLWHWGNEVALEWDGSGNAAFSAGERFIFYADPRFSRWSTTDTYILKIGAQPGKRIASREGSPNGHTPGVVWRDLLVEKNVIYTPDCICGDLPLARDGDRWVWDSLSQPGRPTRSYSFSLPSVDSTLVGKLTFWMMGNTSLPAPVDHRVEVAVNNIHLGALEWDGKQVASKTLDLPVGLLTAGQNTLTLSVPVLSGVNLDGMWLDAFQVRYAQGTASLGTSAVLNGDSASHAYTVALDQTQGLRIYNVQTPDAPMRLTNLQVTGSQVSFGDNGAVNVAYALAVEPGLRQPDQVRLLKKLQTSSIPGADYLVITHPDFAPAMSPLLQLRAAQGLTTAVEDVEAIYDQYSAGEQTPEAIRAFLADVYQRWSPPPQYVLLVGDGTNDPKHYHADSSATYIPPMLAVVDPWVGETAADNRFVTVEGSDNLPDMAIGRLPVNSLTEAQTLVAKLVGYETRPDFGLWTRRLALVADEADESGNYPQLNEDLAGLLSPPYQVGRAYYQPPANTSSDIQKAVLDQFNGGAGVIVYTGHASIHQWAAGNFLHISQVPLLHNSGKLPLLLEMDCLTAAFQVSVYPTLDETLLRSPVGGVVAAWGSTGLGIATGHQVLAKNILQDLYGQGQGRIGLEILQAKTVLAATQPAYLDLLDTYTLLGDPASLINVYGKVSASIYLPSLYR